MNKNEIFLSHVNPVLITNILIRLAELLSEQRAATKENVQRKQARTGEERGDSEGEASSSGSESEGEDDGVPYNPKNLPLGWDGKVYKFFQFLV